MPEPNLCVMCIAAVGTVSLQRAGPIPEPASGRVDIALVATILAAVSVALPAMEVTHSEEES